MDMEQISREQIGWLAGIIDGEGCITAGWRYYKPESDSGKYKHHTQRATLYMWLTVSNSNSHLLQRVSEIYKKIPGVGFCYTVAKNKKNNHWIININTTGKGSTRKILELVLPHLTVKKLQAETMLELIDYRISMGYLGKSIKNRPKLQDDPCIQLYLDRLHRLKKEQPILPSETKRRANQILEID